jgi:hypothetical protein
VTLGYSKWRWRLLYKARRHFSYTRLGLFENEVEILSYKNSYHFSDTYLEGYSITNWRFCRITTDANVVDIVFGVALKTSGNFVIHI